MWLGTKNQRIAVSRAGPFVTIIIGSICSIMPGDFIALSNADDWQENIDEAAVIAAGLIASMPSRDD